MGHPLVGDLTVLSQEELYKKFEDLNKRMNQAYRLGMSDAVHQLTMLTEDYRYEMNRRNEKAMAEMAEKSAEFKHIIDVTR